MCEAIHAPCALRRVDVLLTLPVSRTLKQLPQRIEYARGKSDAVAKIEGTWRPDKDRGRKNAAARGERVAGAGATVTPLSRHERATLAVTTLACHIAGSRAKPNAPHLPLPRPAETLKAKKAAAPAAAAAPGVSRRSPWRLGAEGTQRTHSPWWSGCPARNRPARLVALVLPSFAAPKAPAAPPRTCGRLWPMPSSVTYCLNSLLHPLLRSARRPPTARRRPTRFCLCRTCPRPRRTRCWACCSSSSPASGRWAPQCKHARACAYSHVCQHSHTGAQHSLLHAPPIPTPGAHG